MTSGRSEGTGRSVLVLVHGRLDSHETAETACDGPRRRLWSRRPSQVDDRERVVGDAKHHVVAPCTLRHGMKTQAVQFVARCHLRARLVLEGLRVLGIRREPRFAKALTNHGDIVTRAAHSSADPCSWAAGKTQLLAIGTDGGMSGHVPASGGGTDIEKLRSCRLHTLSRKPGRR